MRSLQEVLGVVMGYLAFFPFATNFYTYITHQYSYSMFGVLTMYEQGRKKNCAWDGLFKLLTGTALPSASFDTSKEPQAKVRACFLFFPHAQLNPKYLHSNSTSHTWPFGAIAELIGET